MFGNPNGSTIIRIDGIPQLKEPGMRFTGWEGTGKFLDIIINFQATGDRPYIIAADAFNGFAIIDLYGETTDPISVIYGSAYPVPPVPLPFSNFMLCLNVGKTSFDQLNTCDVQNNFPGPPFQTVFGYAANSAALTQALCYIKEFKGLRTPSLEISQVGGSWHFICLTPSSNLIRQSFFQLKSTSSSIFVKRRN